MKKNGFHLGFFMGLVTLVFVLSCSKDESKRNKLQESKLRTNVQPILENGTLKFNTKQEAFEYMENLTAILKAGKNGTDSTDAFINPVIDLNNSLKNSLGFTSLFEVSSKDADGNLINSIFPDDAFNLMLNPNYEIIIGDRLYVHKNTSEHYHIAKSDLLNKAELRKITPGGRLDLKYLNDGIILVGPEVENRTLCDCTFELTRSKKSNATMHEYNLRFWCSKVLEGQEWKMTWTSPSGNDRGQMNGTINNYDVTATNPEPRTITFKVPINVGDFKVKFCVEADCGDGLKEHCFEIPFLYSEECCSDTDTDIPDKFVIFQNEGYKLVATYKNGSNFWGYYHYGHLAFIRLSDGQKLKAKKLEIFFDVTNRTSPSTFPPCSPFSETDDDDCTNCKWISENIYADDETHNFHKRGDVMLNFKGSRGTTVGTIQMKPEYCY